MGRKSAPPPSFLFQVVELLFLLKAATKFCEKKSRKCGVKMRSWVAGKEGPLKPLKLSGKCQGSYHSKKQVTGLGRNTVQCKISFYF